jgi:hypothetical protein
MDKIDSMSDVGDTGDAKSQVRAQMGNISDQISALDTSLEVLQNRLACVLRPEEPRVSSSRIDDDDIVPHADEIRIQGKRLIIITDIVTNMIDKLEL